MRIDSKLDAKSYMKLHSALVHLHALNFLEETSGDNGILSFKLDLPTNERSNIKYVFPYIESAKIKNAVDKIESDTHHTSIMVISYLYRAGLGLPKDAVLAEVWFNFAHKTVTVIEGKDVDMSLTFKKLKKHVSKLGRLAYLEDYLNQSAAISSSVDTTGDVKTRSQCVATPMPKGVDATFIYVKQLDGSYSLYAVSRPGKGMLERILTLRSSEEAKLNVPTKLNLKLKSSYVAISTRGVVENVDNVVRESGSYEVEDILKQVVEQGHTEIGNFIPDMTRSEKSSLKRQLGDLKELRLAIRKVKGKRLKDPAIAKRRSEDLAKYKLLKAKKKDLDIVEANAGRVLPAQSLTYYAYDLLVGSGLSEFKSPKVPYSRLQEVITTEGFNVMPYVVCKGSKINVKSLTKAFKLDFKSVRVRREVPSKSTSGLALWVKHKV